MLQQFGRLIADVETVCQMKRYYAQLTMMKSRFPMEEGDPLKIPFSWLVFLPLIEIATMRLSVIREGVLFVIIFVARSEPYRGHLIVGDS